MKTLIIVLGLLIVATVCHAELTIEKQYVSRFADPRVVNETMQEQRQRERYQREVIEILRDMQYMQQQKALGMTLGDEW